MSNIFDKLHDQIGNQAEQGGISILDLQGLPSPHRSLMRIMLREVNMTYEELVEANLGMPEDKRLTGNELDQALDLLTKQSWLIRMGDEGDHITYKVNLRAKPGSQLGTGIWGLIDDKVDPSQQPDSADNVEL